MTDCLQCGGPIAPDARIGTRFCSAKCRYAYRDKSRVRTVEQRACLSCGNQFTPKRTNGRVCSSACRQRLYRHRAKRGEAGKLRAAIHEAGHAVCAFVMGVRLELVSVRHAGSTDGRVVRVRPARVVVHVTHAQVKRASALAARMFAYQEAVVLYGGRAGEIAFYGDHTGFGGDSRSLAELRTECAYRIVTWNKLLHRACVCAGATVAKHKDAIEQLAQALVASRTGTLAGDEAERIFHQAAKLRRTK